MKTVVKRILLYLVRIFIRPFYGRGIWLIADRPNSATDNGAAFFEFMRDMPERTIFVLDKNCSDYHRIKQFGEVIEPNSIKFHILLSSADVYISSHNTHMKNHVEMKCIFVQHGVCMNDLHTYFDEVQHANYYICVASKGEERRFKSDRYHVQSSHVWTTGFPRFDYLENKPKKKIVIALTWRAYECGKDMDDFLKSSYYKAFEQLVTDSDIRHELENFGYELCYIAHPMTKKFLDELCFDGVKEMKNYTQVFAEGDLLISDYSSVVCDFAYLKKPVIFYQFDRDSFFGGTWVKQDFDYEQDGFGPVVIDYESLKNKIISYIRNGCKMEDEYMKKFEAYLLFHDRNNCIRVYEKIKEII